jgi:hypothetical protein
LYFSTERNLDSSGLSIAPPMRPRAATSTIVPRPVQGLSARSRRQEGESGDEAQSPAPSKSHLESLAKQAENVGSSAQSDDAGRVDDASPMPNSDDDDQGDFDIPGFDQYGEGEDSNKPMDVSNDEGDIGERTPQKRGRERAESGNPRLKKSGRNTSTDDPEDPSPFESEDLNRQGASRTTGGIFRGKATGSHFNWGDAPQFMDDGPQLQPIPMGKVFLFGSRDKNAHPHLSITTQTDTQLPPILKRLSAKYSPIKSKCILLYIIDR